MKAGLSTGVHSNVLMFAVMLTIHSEAAVRYVDINNENPIPPYISWPAAASNIQDAVNVSSDGDSILVAEGRYFLTAEITVTNNINIIGAGDPELTVVDGGRNSCCFHLGGNAGILAGFTICNGAGLFDKGGGIYCESRDPVVVNCIIKNNVSGEAAGMLAGTAYRCVFQNNDAYTFGGGGMSGGVAYDCSFIDNEALSADGGALLYSDAFNCWIASNTASSCGGGMYGGTARNCSLIGNQALYGGGMAHGIAVEGEVRQNRAICFSGFNCGEGGGLYEVDAVNLLLDENIAYWSGGGMYGGSALGCIITNNVADQGGGAYGAKVQNGLVVGNRADHGGGIYGGAAINCTIMNNAGWLSVDGAKNVSVSNCIVQGSAYDTGSSGSVYTFCCSPEAEHGVNGNITNAPLFAGGWQLAFDSPCIDAGNNAGVLWPLDLEGNPRIINGAVDMGAFEYNAALHDSDSDGISDEWELLYFSCATGCVAYGHGDEDSCNNIGEFIAGTDPTNAGSFFKVTQAYSVDTDFVVEWNPVSNRRYSVIWTPQLTNEFQPLEVGIQYPQSSYTDSVHTVDSSGFYSLEVEMN